MSTSANSAFASFSPFTQVILHASLKCAQSASLIVPPAYLVSSLLIRRGKPFSVARLMRASTSGVVIGGLIGAGLGYARLRNEPESAVIDRMQRLKANWSQVRTDDYSVIGATISALVVPAVFLRRARLPTLVLGGASMGLGAGVWVHLARMFTEGEDVKPEGMVGEIPVVGGNK